MAGPACRKTAYLTVMHISTSTTRLLARFLLRSIFNESIYASLTQYRALGGMEPMPELLVRNLAIVDGTGNPFLSR